MADTPESSSNDCEKNQSLESECGSLIRSYYDSDSKRKQRDILRRLLGILTQDTENQEIFDFIDGILEMNLETQQQNILLLNLTSIPDNNRVDTYLIKLLASNPKLYGRSGAIIRLHCNDSIEAIPTILTIFYQNKKAIIEDTEVTDLCLFYLIDLLENNRRKEFLKTNIDHFSNSNKKGVIDALVNVPWEQGIEILNEFFINDKSSQIRNYAMELISKLEDYKNY